MDPWDEGALHLFCIAGEELITQGWPNSQMFFLRNSTGYVDMVVKVDGKEQIIDTLTGGNCFGETALLPLPSSEALQQVRPALCLSCPSLGAPNASQRPYRCCLCRQCYQCCVPDKWMRNGMPDHNALGLVFQKAVVDSTSTSKSLR